MALTVNLNDVQHEPIVVSASLTAVNNRYYVNVASSTYTDPSPVEGKGFIVFVRNGTATIGGTAYATAGTLIYRYFHSGAWANTSLDLTTKQDTLVSGTNIKTVGGTSLLGSGNISVGTGDALVANPLSQFAATTSAELAGVISDETGTDKLVFNTSPTFATQTSTTAITATTANNDVLQILTNNSSGTPAASYGLSRLIQLKTTTTDSQTAGKEIFSWATATHASRQSQYAIQLVGNASVGNLQDAFRIVPNGNSFQFDFVTHTGYYPKLNLYNGVTPKGSWQVAGDDMYFSTTLGGALMYFRPGNGLTAIELSTTAMTFSNAVNLIFNTTTGSKIGTTTSQKLAFWNKTPIIQPASANQAALTNSTGGSYDGTLVDVGVVFNQANINNNFTDIYTVLNEIRNVLVNTGLMKGAA